MSILNSTSFFQTVQQVHRENLMRDGDAKALVTLYKLNLMIILFYADVFRDVE